MTFQPTDLATCLVIALACSGIAMSFTQGSMFDSLRAWILRQNQLLGSLAGCFFCLSHWLAFVGVAVYLPRPLRSELLLVDLIVASFAIVTLSTLSSGLMFAGFFTAGQFHALRERMLAAKAAAASRA
jgi:hypothetical protein